MVSNPFVVSFCVFYKWESSHAFVFALCEIEIAFKGVSVKYWRIEAGYAVSDSRW